MTRLGNCSRSELETLLQVTTGGIPSFGSFKTVLAVPWLLPQLGVCQAYQSRSSSLENIKRPVSNPASKMRWSALVLAALAEAAPQFGGGGGNRPTMLRFGCS